MELRIYLAEKRITNKQFAKKIGYNPAYVGQIRRGHVLPGKGILKAIIIETDGMVTEEDFKRGFEKTIPESSEML